MGHVIILMNTYSKVSLQYYFSSFMYQKIMIEQLQHTFRQWVLLILFAVDVKNGYIMSQVIPPLSVGHLFTFITIFSYIAHQVVDNSLV